MHQSSCEDLYIDIRFGETIVLIGILQFKKHENRVLEQFKTSVSILSQGMQRYQVKRLI